MRQVNPRHLKFIAAYIENGGNASQAYKAAYPNCKSAQAAGSGGYNLLKKPHVQAKLAQKTAAAEQKIDSAISHHLANKGRIMDEATKLALSNMKDFVRINQAGDPVVDLSGLGADQWAAVKTVTIETYMDGKGEDAREVKRVKFELYDKAKSLMDLAKLKGYVVDKKQVTHRQLRDMDLEELHALMGEVQDIESTPVPALSVQPNAQTLEDMPNATPAKDGTPSEG